MMRKIHEISGDEFFDVIYALSPILHMVTDMEIVQTRISGKADEKIAEAQRALMVERAKKKPCPEKIQAATKIIRSESASMLVRDLTKTIPLLTSKQHRGSLFEVLAILEQKTVDEIKSYTSPKLISMVTRLIRDTDFSLFLDYAEQSESNE